MVHTASVVVEAMASVWNKCSGYCRYRYQIKEKLLWLGDKETGIPVHRAIVWQCEGLQIIVMS